MPDRLRLDDHLRLSIHEQFVVEEFRGCRDGHFPPKMLDVGESEEALEGIDQVGPCVRLAEVEAGVLQDRREVPVEFGPCVRHGRRIAEGGYILDDPGMPAIQPFFLLTRRNPESV